MRLIPLALTLLFCSCGLHKSELDETLEWMDNTYNPHVKENGSYGHGRFAWYAPGPDMTGLKDEEALCRSPDRGKRSHEWRVTLAIKVLEGAEGDIFDNESEVKDEE
jgi:hypothetical protein